MDADANDAESLNEHKQGRRAQGPRLFFEACHLSNRTDDPVLCCLWSAAKSRPQRFARKIEFVKAIQSDSTSPVPFKKIFRFAANPNHFHIPRRPVPQRAMDAGGASDEGAAADGEVVWSWRLDAGVKFADSIRRRR